MSIRVTVVDLETGDTESSEIADDVMVIVHGTAAVDSIQNYAAKGKQVWTISGIKGGAA